MAWLAPALVHSGFVVICPDMPGFGQTPGPRPPTRSDRACDSGGAADLVQRLILAFGARSAVLVGYDWGAGIALSMAASGRHLVYLVYLLHHLPHATSHTTYLLLHLLHLAPLTPLTLLYYYPIPSPSSGTAACSLTSHACTQPSLGRRCKAS